MSRQKLNIRYITGIALVSALGGLLFGYDWVVIGGAKPFYEQFFGIANSPQLQGWAVSCALVGCIMGTVLAGMFSDKYGRKKLLITAAALFLFSAAGTGFSNQFSFFVVFRIIGGIGIGLASNLSPVYIAEVSPAGIRGRFVAINQLTIVIGILLAQLVNFMIAKPVPADYTGVEILNSWNGQSGWRFMFWAEIVPAAMFFILMWLVPDSPRWLLKNKFEARAASVLRKIGGEEYAKKTKAEIDKTLFAKEPKVKLNDLLQKGVVPILVIGVVLAVFQQWCGINVIFLFADEVFSSAGYDVSDMLFNVVITGSINLVFTIIAMTLVDRIGRKVLLIIGAGGLAVIYTIIGSLYYTGVQGSLLLVFVLLAIACYAMTLAPVVWVVLSEIFPNRFRGTAMAIATFALWTGNTLLAFFFPIINNAIKISGSFWLFAGICLAGLLFIIIRVKETKGKTLEEIEAELNINPIN